MTSLLWLIPALPFAAAGIIALLPKSQKALAVPVALAAQFGAAAIALVVMLAALPAHGKPSLVIATVHPWIALGSVQIPIGLMLDPMGAAMTAMVAFVAFWIFVYSVAYMKEDPRRPRFFGFLSLFSGAMLLLVLSNSLLLLFMAWELVGVASFLLIGYYFNKPSAAAAAQKAFLTTRVGDLLFFLGMIWLHAQSGTLLFYDSGRGLLESGALHGLAGATTVGGLAVSTAATLLLLGGAMGKSGQMPLHAWLPDAMEGPTPVSALIHAATMVAAGVFLVARTHPIFGAAADAAGLTASLSATAWVGAITALLAALCAIGQTDIKRLLAWSTISQLGFMMIALGTGGVAAGLFHLIAHAFFKALLFLSAGSVIHGCHEDQDMRAMGGLARKMPRTFLVYAIGMMALAGFPFLFSGFWSKEAILHSAQGWAGGKGPFFIAAAAALCTAYYMTKQLLDVFFGDSRGEGAKHAHESPPLMILPMVVLANGAVLLSLIGTPAWPWFEAWMNGHEAHWHPAALWEHGGWQLIALSLVLVTVGVGGAWVRWRGRKPGMADAPPAVLAEGLFFDRFQEKVLGPITMGVATVFDRLDRILFLPMICLGEILFRWIGGRAGDVDEQAWNAGFNRVCGGLKDQSTSAAAAQQTTPQIPLRAIGIAVVALFLLFLWIR